ncbi:hypothetical protein KPMX200_310024 [Klebsiella pneumoniae]|nr:hypothetical protein KPMX200_310024 [Klebsiella pneumoniae]
MIASVKVSTTMNRRQVFFVGDMKKLMATEGYFLAQEIALVLLKSPVTGKLTSKVDFEWCIG